MFIHIVKAGETLNDIATMYNVSYERLISDNGVPQPNNLVVGQAIVVLIPEVIHTVTSGETIQGIASQYGLTEMELLQNNPFLTSQPELLAGETLVISFADEKLRSVLVNSYAYPNIEDLVLEYALPFLTQLTIFGYGFTRSGELIGIDDEELISKAFAFNAIPIMLLSTVDETGEFNSETVKYIFADQEIQNNLIENIVATMKENGYLGLDIDFEFVDPASKQQYIDFIRNVTNRLHAEGFTVNVDLAPKTSAEQTGLLYEAHDYRAIGEIVDTVLVMTYEWGYTYGPPMAVAPLNSVKTVLNYALSEIPPEKILLGIPNYGYDWKLPYVKGESRAETIGNLQAVQRARLFGAEIQFDELAQAPFYTYIAPDGSEHIVWFEDARSILAKLSLVQENNLRGVGYWNTMRPFPQNWAVLNNLFEIEKN